MTASTVLTPTRFSLRTPNAERHLSFLPNLRFRRSCRKCCHFHFPHIHSTPRGPREVHVASGAPAVIISIINCIQFDLISDERPSRSVCVPDDFIDSDLAHSAFLNVNALIARRGPAVFLRQPLFLRTAFKLLFFKEKKFVESGPDNEILLPVNAFKAEQSHESTNSLSHFESLNLHAVLRRSPGQQDPRSRRLERYKPAGRKLAVFKLWYADSYDVSRWHSDSEDAT